MSIYKLTGTSRMTGASKAQPWLSLLLGRTASELNMCSLGADVMQASLLQCMLCRLLQTHRPLGGRPHKLIRSSSVWSLMKPGSWHAARYAVIRTAACKLQLRHLWAQQAHLAGNRGCDQANSKSGPKLVTMGVLSTH